MEDIPLFNEISFKCCKLITENYSTWFSIGIKLVDKKYHHPIYSIYGFLKFAREIVDTFLPSDRKRFLDCYERDTFEAINNGLSFNPVLNAFQLTVNEYKIERNLIEAFFHSMKIDLQLVKYDNSIYDEYIYGSAEVVGLMCLKIFCKDNTTSYLNLKESASKMSLALYKISFLRDIKNNYEIRGRILFPDLEFKDFDESLKIKFEKDIEEDFSKASLGIDQLPEKAEPGVYMIYFLHKKLLEKVKTTPIKALSEQRVDVSKLAILTSEKFFYFWLNIMIMSVPFMLSFDERLNYFAKCKALFPAIAITAAFFVPWDVYFTNRKIWKFNSRYIIGYKVFGIPVEEWMFFFTVPYSCVLMHESLKYFFPNDILSFIAKPFFFVLLPMIITLGLYNFDKMNTFINSMVAVGMIVIHCCIFGDELLGRFLFTLIMHYIPFLVCNGLMSGSYGMKEPLCFYNESETIKLKIGTIPIEDAIYSLSLLLMNISLFELFLSYFSI